MPKTIAKKDLQPQQQQEVIRVSVVVPCRNEIAGIRDFLNRLERQDLGPMEMEILIADGMSVDGTRLVLREFENRYPGIKVLDNPEKLASVGLNRAIREAQGDVVLRMDVHTIYALDYVRSCVELLLQSDASNVGGPARTRADGYIARAIALGFHAPFATGGAKFRDPDYEGPVRTVPYGCWRRSTLQQIGLFDEDLRRGQDDELNFRIVSAGGAIWQSPKIVSWYRPRTTLRGLFWQLFQNGFWKTAILRKHGRVPAWRNLVPGACLLAAIAFVVSATAANLYGSPRYEKLFLFMLAIAVGLYATASFTSAWQVARRNGWKYFPILPLVFATYQLAYGLGFLAGICWRPAHVDRQNPRQRILPALPK